MFNNYYSLHFRSSSLHYLQFSRVRFLPPYLCQVFQLWHNHGFIQPQYTILSVVTIAILLLIGPKVELSYFAAPLLGLEGFALITHKSISSPLTLYMDTTHKSEHKEL